MSYKCDCGTKHTTAAHIDHKAAPTLNPTYNNLLVKWNKERNDNDPECEPECENCGMDLTKEPVWDTGILWVCCGCVHEIVDRNEQLYPIGWSKEADILHMEQSRDE